MPTACIEALAVIVLKFQLSVTPGHEIRLSLRGWLHCRQFLLADTAGPLFALSLSLLANYWLKHAESKKLSFLAFTSTYISRFRSRKKSTSFSLQRLQLTEIGQSLITCQL